MKILYCLYQYLGEGAAAYEGACAGSASSLSSSLSEKSDRCIFGHIVFNFLNQFLISNVLMKQSHPN